MKNKILFYIALALFPFLNSCEDEVLDVVEPMPHESTWADVATLKFAPTDPLINSFEYNKVLGPRGNEFWNVTTLDLTVNVELGQAKINEISKIELYVFAEETNGDSFKYLGGDQGKLLKTITNPSKSFNFSISRDELSDLFKNDFSANHNGEVLVDDVFELKWSITGKNGKVIDTRTGCKGFACTYGFGSKIVEVAPPIWEGTFNYEWTKATANAITYGRISVGQTGTMTFTLKPGSYVNYDVSHVAADYYYSGAGELKYGYEDGTIEISGGSSTRWNIVDINGPTLTIDFSYSFSASFDEYGTFTLTRTDGQDWPTNLKAL